MLCISVPAVLVCSWAMLWSWQPQRSNRTTIVILPSSPPAPQMSHEQAMAKAMPTIKPMAVPAPVTLSGAAAPLPALIGQPNPPSLGSIVTAKAVPMIEPMAVPAPVALAATALPPPALMGQRSSHPQSRSRPRLRRRHRAMPTLDYPTLDRRANRMTGISPFILLCAFNACRR
jgi:hypothetical protein